MKKILSVTLAIIMLLSVMMVAIPATAATPIEATPYSNWSINGEHFGNMQKTLINTLGFTTTQGVLIEPWDTSATLSVESNKIVSSTVGATIKYDTETAPSIDGVNSVIMYVKTDSANTLLPVIAVTNRGNISWVKWDVEMSLAFGSTYYYAALGDTEWTEATAGASGHSNEAQQVRWGTVSFDSAFEGYIKIPLTSLSSDTYTSGVISTDTVAHIWTRFQYGGVGYGSCAFGPVFFVTKDSTSTQINVPDEYKPAPIEATPITGWKLIGSSTAARTQVMPLEKFTTAQGVKFTSDTETVIDKTALAGSTNAYARLWYSYQKFTDDTKTVLSNAYVLSDDFKNQSIIFYVKTDSANALHIQTGQSCAFSYYVTPTLAKDGTYYVAEIGSEEWISKTATTVGNTTTGETRNGVIEFDSAFEGYVKIPWSSFSCDTAFTNRIGSVEFRVAGVGGSYGSVTIAPVFEVTQDSPSTEINIPDEYKPAPLDVKSIEMGTVRSRHYNFSNEKVDNGYNLYIDSSVFGDSDSAWVSGAETWTYVENAYTGSSADANLIMKPAIPLAAKDVNGFLVYLKTETANEFALTVEYEKGTHWTKSWNPTISLKPGKTVEVLAAGSDDWQEMTIEKGGIYSEDNYATLIYGKVCFDEAFEGYIKIPFASFGNDSGWAPYTTTTQGAIDRIIAFQPAFKGIGSAKYGEELVTDIVGFFTEDSPLTTYEVSEAVYDTGDVNNDCFVNVTDLAELKKHLLGVAAEASVKYANVNGDTDGVVNILDFIRLKKTLAGA